MSYITLQSDKAIALANSVLNRIEVSRKRKVEKLFQEYFTALNSRLFTRWGWQKKVGEKAARKSFDARSTSWSDNPSRWYAENYGYEVEIQALELKKSARLAERVNLSTEDAALLEDWAWDEDLATIFGETDYRGNPLCTTKTG